jgi:hypothetical protein
MAVANWVQNSLIFVAIVAKNSYLTKKNQQVET